MKQSGLEPSCTVKHVNKHKQKADLVLQGGGVKGIGLVGALSVAEDLGYSWERVAGTSAGAIVAALIAAGYNAPDLYRILLDLDFRKLLDPYGFHYIPLVGSAINIVLSLGLYKGDELEAWMRELLAKKGITSFGDLRTGTYSLRGRVEPRHTRLQVIASDVSSSRMVVLPRDAKMYGIDPERLDVARAVRMSASLPFFFQPVRLQRNRQGTTLSSLSKRSSKNCLIVDGGLLSNFPVWLFDAPENPAWPTFGFRLISREVNEPRDIRGFRDYVGSLLGTMLEAHDKQDMAERDFVRTINIPTVGVHTTDFHLSVKDKVLLYQSGIESARDFFSVWDFNGYVASYRSGSSLA